MNAEWIRAGHVSPGDWWCKGQHGTCVRVDWSVTEDGKVRLTWPPHGVYDWAEFAPETPLWIIRDDV
jgi:hypothetical protein